MAAVSEQARVNFNPEWMGSTYSSSGKLGQGGGNNLATSPPFTGGGGRNGGGNSTAYCGGSAANNADSNVLAPPKLAKNRYSREEMLALFTGPATIAPPELKPTFPEFYIDRPQDPICMLPYSEIEERLLLQGGINSSKVINVVNHAERAMRWSQGPPRSYGRGIPGGGDSPVGEVPPDGIPGPQAPAPPFAGNRPFAPGGAGRGMGRGGYQMAGGFDQMTRPPGRYGGMGRGRGEMGRGRGFERGPGGFGGGPGPLPHGGPRFSEGTGGGQPQNEEEWAPQNTRAQALYDPNDPRDRPRQRQKSTSRAEDMDEPGFVQPSHIRNSNAPTQRRSYSASVGQAVPEWAMEDDDGLGENAVGTFDATGQFHQEMEENSSVPLGKTNASSKTASPETQQEGNLSETIETSDSTGKPGAHTADRKTSKIQGRSIPVESLFNVDQDVVENNQRQSPLQNISQNILNVSGGSGQNVRRLPKAFAALTSLQETQKSSVVSMVAMDRSSAPQKEVNDKVQPKPVVPKTISSSSDEVFNQLHEDVESLVNSFSADDMPTVVRPQRSNNYTEPPISHQSQKHSVGVGRGFPGLPATGTTKGPVNMMRNVSSAVTGPAKLDRPDVMNLSKDQRTSQKWYYKDPQGGLRGPFENAQMAAWFAAGYFTMHLLLRRAEDADFVPLGDLIKQYGRIPFMVSPSSSAANTPSPNPVSSVLAAASTFSVGDPIVQPAARYGVAESVSSGHNVPSNIAGALKNTGGGAFHKTGAPPALSTKPNSNNDAGGLWDMDFTSGCVSEERLGNNDEINADVQTQLTILNQMLQKEREAEMRRRAEEEERQRKLAEAQEAERREKERQLAVLKEKEDELKRLQEARLEAERQRKEEKEEEGKRIEQQKRSEEKRRLEELARKEADEKRNREAAEEELRRKKAEEERLRKEQAAREAAAERERKEQEKKAAAALKREQELKKRQQQQKKAAAPWGPPQQRINGVADSQNVWSLAEIQKDEEKQLMVEKEHEVVQEIQRKKDLSSANLQLGSAWGGPAAASKLKWDQQQAALKSQCTKGGPAWGGKGEIQNVGGQGGLWDDDESPFASPQKSKNTKSNQPNSKKAKQKTVSPSAPSKKEENVKKLFQPQKAAFDEFSSWCIKQVNALNSDIDAITFVSFLKEVEAPSEVEDYMVSYFGDCRAARDFMKSFLEKRATLRKTASSAKAQADDLSTPAPALNPMKSSGGENVVPHSNEKSSGSNGGKKKKSTKSAGRFVVDGSILGFKPAADPNRLNAGEIDSPM